MTEQPACESQHSAAVGHPQTRCLDLTAFDADMHHGDHAHHHSGNQPVHPAEFAKLIGRFFATGIDILSQTDAIIDNLAGDQVSGYYVPGLVGPNHALVAVRAAQALLQATGHGDPGGPWIQIGIGVHTGEAFIGAVGTQGGITDVTALGDSVNIAARLGANAGPGEILVSQETYLDAGFDLGGLENRDLTLKGRSKSVSVYAL